MTDRLLEQLDADLPAAANPDDAAAMRAYMRDRFEFVGVKTPERRSISKPLVQASRSVDLDELIGLVDALRARHRREFHYVASDILAANARRLEPAHLVDLRHWIVRDAWWDTVDAIASPTVGAIALRHPSAGRVMDEWIDDDDIWVARTAILHQLRFKERTDASRLFAHAERRSDDDEFFIRKAIGWALRQYARTDPAAVRTFVDEHRDRLAPLTVREATKHLT